MDQILTLQRADIQGVASIEPIETQSLSKILQRERLFLMAFSPQIFH